MRKNSQYKADKLERFLNDLFTSCDGDCKYCVLENICDDLSTV